MRRPGGAALRSARLVSRRLRRALFPAGADAYIPGRLAQLAVDVLPLPHAQKVQVFPAAHSAKRGSGQLALPLVQVIPQGEERQEVGTRLGEPCMRGEI